METTCAYERAQSPQKGAPRVLLLGYNGANNTGAEALLQADIADVRAVLGPEAIITIPTLNETNLRRYVKDGPNLRIVRIPTLFFAALRRLVNGNDVLLLVEGSTYMDTWSSAMLWAYLWATRCAHAMGKPSLAYAVDAGELSTFNQRLARREASKTGLIIARSKAAARRLRAFGVTAPLEDTADNAFTFQPECADEGLVQRVWPEAGSGVVGLAVVDFHLWPVVVRPWGRRKDCYKWPYYFSRSPERDRASEALVCTYATLADAIVVEHGKSIALIAMEQVDEPIARRIAARMAQAGAARVFSSREFNASEMTVLLRSLDLLITSRYHAAVLSMAARVPQMAVGHDLRLKSLYEEIGLSEEFFFPPDRPGLGATLLDRTRMLLSGRAEAARDALGREYAGHREKAERNRALLRAFFQAHGWEIRV